MKQIAAWIIHRGAEIRMGTLLTSGGKNYEPVKFQVTEGFEGGRDIPKVAAWEPKSQWEVFNHIQKLVEDSQVIADRAKIGLSWDAGTFFDKHYIEIYHTEDCKIEAQVWLSIEFFDNLDRDLLTRGLVFQNAWKREMRVATLTEELLRIADEGVEDGQKVAIVWTTEGIKALPYTIATATLQPIMDVSSLVVPEATFKSIFDSLKYEIYKKIDKFTRGEA